MRKVGIRHVSFGLGEQKVWYRDLEGIEEAIRESQIPDEEELWGWGYCHRSVSDYRGHVARGFREVSAYLTREGIAIDTVIGCGPFQTGSAEFSSALASEGILRSAGGGGKLHLVAGFECVNVLQALREATDRVQEGEENVLILAAEWLDEDPARFRPWCFFSDFCLALVVSARIDDCRFELRDVSIRSDPDPAEDGSRVFSRELETHCVGGLLAANGLPHSAVDRFLYMNLFQPIAEMKGKEVGFGAEQLYTGLGTELGHCYGADPFINLHTFCERAGGGETFVLCASGREYAGAAIVRRIWETGC